MYASEVKSENKVQPLTFFVSGKLWGHSLVMGDKETGSEWSHILGEAMAGQMKGAALKIIPSVMTNWGDWKAKHPETTATMIDPTAVDFQREMLHESTRFGLGLVYNGQSRFWRFDRLTSDPLINDELGKLALVIYFDSKNKTPIAWNRELEESPGKLSFKMTAQGVQDTATESIWDLKLGAATAGALKGTKLRGVPAIVSFTRAWERFHPETTVWKP